MSPEPRPQPLLDLPPHGPVEQVVGVQFHLRPPPRLATEEFRDRRLFPAQLPVRRESDVVVRRGHQPVRAAPHLLRDRLPRGCPDGPGIPFVPGGIGREPEAGEGSDVLSFNHHLAVLADRPHEFARVLQAPHQGGHPAVHEAAGQRRVQRVGQPVLDVAGVVPQAAGILDPVHAVGDVAPDPDMVQAGDQQVEAAVHAIERGHLRMGP